MPFIEMALGDVGEQYAAPSGTYDLVVLKAEEAASRAAKEEHGDDAEPNMLVVTIGIQSDEHPDAAPFRAWFTYPDGGDYDDMRIREIKRFLYWFNVPMEGNGFNTEDIEGATAQGIQVEKSVNEQSGREFNEMVLDPIPSDDAGSETTEEEAPLDEEAPAEEEVVEEEQPEEEEVAEEEVVEEEVAPSPRRQTARPAARPSGKATRAAPKVAPKAAPKAAAKKAAAKGRR